MNQIEIDNLQFGYTKELVIKRANFKQEKGQIVSIHGENGSGKSTLLKLILGELTPDKGTIKLLGEDIKKINNFSKIAYVPQIQTFSGVAFPITTTEIVVLNLYREFGLIKIPKKEHKEKARKILCEMGLENYLNTPYNQLSGGFKQRTMIARAMLSNPDILILDEPTAGVDQQSKENFLELVAETNRTKSTTILVVTHEMELIKQHLKPDESYKMVEGVLEKC
ncbi:metal ABC transporter ATP-binding protein [Eubacteriales bacterium KG127]